MAELQELQKNEIIYIIILGSLGMLTFVIGFAIFIMIYQKRMLKEQEKRRKMELEYHQTMIQSQIDSQEVERKRIAADLHDSLGSLLWAAKLNVAFLGRSFAFKDEQFNSYRETMNILDQSIDSVKRISWELTPESFQHSGLAGSINELCNRLDGKGLTVSFEQTGEPFFWQDNHALMAYRIVQELINNSIKHSKASSIDVKLTWASNHVSIQVRDDGIGFDPESRNVKDGLGWWNITNRSKKINAVISVQTNKEKGSSIEISIPINETADYLHR